MAPLAVVAPYLLAGGAVISAAGAIEQGRAARKQANYQAKVEENNATIAGYQAIEARKAADREADAIREQRLRVLASQKTAASAAGLTISGSVTDVMSDSAIAAEKDIQMAKYRGDVGAYNSTNEARNLRSQSILTRQAGKNAQRASYFSAGGSLLTGFGAAGAAYKPTG